MNGTVIMDNVKGYTVSRDSESATVSVDFRDGAATVRVELTSEVAAELSRELA